MRLKRFAVPVVLMLLLALLGNSALASGQLVPASDKDAAQGVPAKVAPNSFLLWCSGYSELVHRNEIRGGTAQATVTCPITFPPQVFLVHLEVKVQRTDLNPEDPWHDWLSSTKDCRLSGFDLRCQLDISFLNSGSLPDRARAYRVQAVMTVNGSDGVQLPVGVGDSLWVYNRRGMPYPDYQFIRGRVPFPTLIGPWTGGDSRDNGQWVRACDRWYRDNWGLPDGSYPTQHHHVHPLAHGGRNLVENCYIMPQPMHDRYTAWWAAFNP